MYTFIEGGERQTLTTIREFHSQLATTLELALSAKRAIAQSQSHLANAKAARNKRNVPNYVRANHSARLGFASLRTALNNDIALVWEMLTVMASSKDQARFRVDEPRWENWEKETYYVNMVCCFELMQTALRTSMEHRDVYNDWHKVDLPTVSALRDAGLPSEVRAVKQWMHAAPEFPDWFGGLHAGASALLFRCIDETANAYGIIMANGWDCDRIYDFDSYCKDVVQTDVAVDGFETADRMMVASLLTSSGWKVEETQRARGRKAVANWTITRPVGEPATTVSLEDKLKSLNSQEPAAA